MDTTAPESKEHLPMLFGSEFAATIQVEVCQKRTSAARAEDVKMHVMNLLQRHPVIYRDYTWSKFDNEFLQKHVNSVAVVDTEMHLVDSKAVDLLNSQLQLHVFQLWEDGPATEELEQDNEALSAASHWLLPAAMALQQRTPPQTVLGLTKFVNLLTWISPKGKSSFLDFVFTNIPANVSCYPSATIGSSDHKLVMVNISLAILSEAP
uniref:pachytene checkpoint protein 2 homolog n=1 Tax=Myxine glutinosa TaxID=7769 RepID=UPI00358E1B92